jgi:hypothetical protein
MTPLDQVNRDWTRGNCFYVALEFLKDSEQLREEGNIPPSAKVNLVHGLLDSENRKIKHAWIEVDQKVIDHSNNQKIVANKAEYYKDNKAKAIRAFSRKEADALLSYLKSKDGGLPIAYWGDVTNEQIQAAIGAHTPELSVFASNVVFSDPNDPSNSSKIIQE